MPKQVTKLCNCADCGAEIQTTWEPDGVTRIGPGPRRIKDRPYCENCYADEMGLPRPHKQQKPNMMGLLGLTKNRKRD